MARIDREDAKCAKILNPLGALYAFAVIFGRELWQRIN